MAPSIAMNPSAIKVLVPTTLCAIPEHTGKEAYRKRIVQSAGSAEKSDFSSPGSETRWIKKRDKRDASLPDSPCPNDHGEENFPIEKKIPVTDLIKSPDLATYGSQNVVLLGAKTKKTRRVPPMSRMQNHLAETDGGQLFESVILSQRSSQSYDQSAEWMNRLHDLASNASTHKMAPFDASTTLFSNRPPKPDSLKIEFSGKERSRQLKNKKPSPLSRVDESKPSDDDRSLLSPSAKPKLQRFSTAPPSLVKSSMKHSRVVDDALMHRALCIRDNLQQFELEELAAEAERAAESGLEKFVGSTSKFGVEDSPTSNHVNSLKEIDDFIIGPHMTPMRKSASLVSRHFPMDLTPSYLNKKKIRVTALRGFSEVVPSFHDMHSNIRLHLCREGVDASSLPDHDQVNTSAFPFDCIGNNDDTEDDDNLSQASSLNISNAGSITSFGSFAVASLKGMVHYVGRSKSKNKESCPSTMDRMSSKFVQSGKLDTPHKWKQSTAPLTIGKHTNENSSISKKLSVSNSDSDDSSVEWHEWKTSTFFFSERIVKEKPGKTEAINSTKLAEKPFLRSKSVSDTDFRQGEGGPISEASTRKPERSLVRSVSEIPCDKDHIILQRRNLFLDTVGNESGEHCLDNAALHLSPSLLSCGESCSSKQRRHSSPVSNFFTKIQNKFSRSPDDSLNKISVVADEENLRFVENYFYTCGRAKVVNPLGVSNLKLDINPDRQTEAFCMAGCGHNDMIPSCMNVSSVVDMVFDWFGERGSRRKNSPLSFDPNSSQIVIHQSWIKTWQTDTGTHQRHFFMPPRLAVKHGENIIYQYSQEIDLGKVEVG